MEKFLAFIVLSMILFENPAVATKWPHRYFDVSGKIIDWDSKQPIQGATVIVFLNDSPFADNNGYITEKETPAKSQTAKDGAFKERAILLSGSKLPKELKVELIVFKEGYRTERFISHIVDYLAPKNIDSRGGIQELKAELLKIQKQNR